MGRDHSIGHCVVPLVASCDGARIHVHAMGLHCEVLAQHGETTIESLELVVLCLDFLDWRELEGSNNLVILADLLNVHESCSPLLLKPGNNKTVDHLPSIVGVSMILGTKQWLVVVASIEELGNVTTTVGLEDKPATWVRVCEIGHIENQVVKDNKLPFFRVDDGVELLLRHD